MSQNQNLSLFANNIAAANSTGLYYSGTINATSYNVGTSTIANSTGVYTGVVNAASHTVGSVWVANTTGIFITGSLNPTGNSSVIATVLTNAAETTTVSATAATGTINYDVTTQGVLYYTSNASANWTVNFRGNSGTSLNTLMSNNQSLSTVFLVTQGASAYYANAHQIDGNVVTPKWQGGTAPTAGNASGIDIYTYTIIKTASNTYTLLASQTQFK